VSQAVLNECGVAPDAAGLTVEFASQEKVNGFVDALPDCCLRELTRICSEWRKNNVLHELSSCDVWHDVDAPVELVDLRQAERQLAYLFQHNGFQLVRVTSDPRLWTNKPYCDWEPGREVALKTCLAKCLGGRYTIFDGVHRAIQMVRNGEGTIPILYSHK
jgi:hypothetical protein